MTEEGDLDRRWSGDEGGRRLSTRPGQLSKGILSPRKIFIRGEMLTPLLSEPASCNEHAMRVGQTREGCLQNLLPRLLPQFLQQSIALVGMDSVAVPKSLGTSTSKAASGQHC